MTVLRVLLFSLIIVILHALWASFANQTEHLPPVNNHGKLTSLSFAPYWQGFSPLTEKFPQPEQIEADLQLLADKTQSIRTYTSLGGMEPTPELAGKYGISMIQGAWLSSKPLRNQQEIAALIASANAHPDVVKRVIIGNEVMLRKEMDIDSLIGYIRQVKQAIVQPVSYADVWSFYLKYPQLLKEVDYITIHILPYWEDDPVPVGEATAHLEKIVAQFQALEPGKPILIGESGWPTLGRQRGAAAPGVVNAAHYISDMVNSANLHGYDYNIVEAFNQTWKGEVEGVVGANWGIIDVDRQNIIPLSGEIVEHRNWLAIFFLQTLLFTLIIAGYIKQIKSLSLIKLVFFLSFAQIVGIAVIHLADHLWLISYNLVEKAYALFMVAANIGMAILLFDRSICLLKKQPQDQKLNRNLAYFYLLFLAWAIIKTLLLASIGRYLSFPIHQYLVAITGLLALALMQTALKGQYYWHNLSFSKLMGFTVPAIYQTRLCYGLILAILTMISGETINFMQGDDFALAHPGMLQGLPIALKYTLCNQQLLIWLFCLMLFIIPLAIKQEKS